MTKQLTTQNATITTASVEVKTLTISGKQVTLAVFRQLRDAPLVAGDGTLNGEPWGIVNYHPDKCGNDPEHWHVVWQDGTELRRSAVDVVPDFNRRSLHSGQYIGSHTHRTRNSGRYLSALVYMGLTAGGDPLLPTKRRINLSFSMHDTYEPNAEFPVELAGTDAFPVHGIVPDEATAAADKASWLREATADAEKELTDYEKKNAPEWQENLRASRREHAAKVQQQYDEAMTKLRDLIETWGGFDAVGDAYTAEVQAEEMRRKQQLAVRTVLAELPQLFIAV
ncbi:hypothetical protein [Streptomyces sp. NPDC002685]|uniref:hypothetical protein n=1 Tax=Streptomyces sp. NPDC002685 TaxID=3154540 RepID=UPI003319DCB6